MSWESDRRRTIRRHRASGWGANEIDPAIRQIQRVEDMPKKSFVLYGDSSKPGLYLQVSATRAE
jgi:hypothetical protein